MAPFEQSSEKTQSSKNSAPLDPRANQTILLDIFERITVLEQGFHYATLQRDQIVRGQEEMQKEMKALSSTCAGKTELEAIGTYVKQHEQFFQEFRFGLRVAKVGWSIIYICGGAVGMLVVQVIAKKFGVG